MKEKYIVLNFNELGDKNGKITIIEGNKEIPFDMKRIFYIYNTSEGVVRGKHANKKSKFVLVNICGSCEIRVDTGVERKNICLDKPNKGLYLDNMVWKEMYNFSENSILMVISNEYYDEKEYITNYDEFINVISP